MQGPEICSTTTITTTTASTATITNTFLQYEITKLQKVCNVYMYKPERQGPHRAPRPSLHTATPSHSSDNLKHNNTGISTNTAHNNTLKLHHIRRKQTCNSKYLYSVV